MSSMHTRDRMHLLATGLVSFLVGAGLAFVAVWCFIVAPLHKKMAEAEKSQLQEMPAEARAERLRYTEELRLLAAEVLRLQAAPQPNPGFAEVTFNGYRFQVPTQWRAQESSADMQGWFEGAVAVAFFDAGAKVALLRCPPLETGYESWKFGDRKEKAVVSNDGEVYSITLDQGLPYDDDVPGPLSMLRLYSVGNAHKNCSLVSTDETAFSVFPAIFESATLDLRHPPQEIRPKL